MVGVSLILGGLAIIGLVRRIPLGFGACLISLFCDDLCLVVVYNQLVAYCI